MNGHLLRVLIAKKFFAPGIEVDANYKGVDLSGSALVQSNGTFTVGAIRAIGEIEVSMEGASVRDGSKRIIFAQSLTKIDGMDPVRFAASVGIDEHGEKIQEGKRRGRKPKNRIVEIEPDDEDDLMSEIFGEAAE